MERYTGAEFEYPYTVKRSTRSHALPSLKVFIVAGIIALTEKRTESSTDGISNLMRSTVEYNMRHPFFSLRI